MKKITAFFALLLCSGSLLFGQAPTPVQASVDYIHTTYSGAADLSWATVNGVTQGTFTYNDHVMNVGFDAHGAVAYTQTNLLWAEVPGTVMKSHKVSAWGPLSPIAQSKIDQAGVVTYQIKVKNESGKILVMNFGSNGTMIGEAVAETQN